MLQVLQTLGPVFIVIAAGAILRKAGFFNDDSLKLLNKLAYWIGLPCYLMLKLGSNNCLDCDAGKMIGILLSATAGLIVLSFLIAKILKLETWRIGTFVQASFRGNLAYVGLPVVFFAFLGETGDTTAAGNAEKYAAIGLGVMVVVYNVLAVVFLLASSHSITRSALPKMLKGVITNPLLVSGFAGVCWSFTGLGFPKPIPATLEMVGKIALPAALFCVGGSLVSTQIKGNIRLPLIAATLKTCVGPLLGLAAAQTFDAQPDHARIAMIMMATPTAIGSYILATQLKGDGPLSSGGIVFSTLLSLLSLGTVIALTQ